MLLIEDLSHLIPPKAGKVVGIASHRGDYCLVACEYGIFRVWDDGIQLHSSPVYQDPANVPASLADAKTR
jgi:hypothetical protein